MYVEVWTEWYNLIGLIRLNKFYLFWVRLNDSILPGTYSIVKKKSIQHSKRSNISDSNSGFLIRVYSLFHEY